MGLMWMMNPSIEIEQPLCLVNRPISREVPIMAMNSVFSVWVM